MRRFTSGAHVACAAAVLAAGFVATSNARADEEDRADSAAETARSSHHVDERPAYSAEVEPHVLIGWGYAGEGGGLGAGARLSFPISHFGSSSTINSSIAIGVGADFVHFGAGDFVGSASYLDLPLVLQWNCYLNDKWTLFVEPGLRLTTLTDGTRTIPDGINGAGYFGVRYVIDEHFALTVRGGYPSLSVGLSASL